MSAPAEGCAPARSAKDCLLNRGFTIDIKTFYIEIIQGIEAFYIEMMHDIETLYRKFR